MSSGLYERQQPLTTMLCIYRMRVVLSVSSTDGCIPKNTLVGILAYPGDKSDKQTDKGGNPFRSGCRYAVNVKNKVCSPRTRFTRHVGIPLQSPVHVISLWKDVKQEILDTFRTKSGT